MLPVSLLVKALIVWARSKPWLDLCEGLKRFQY